MRHPRARKTGPQADRARRIVADRKKSAIRVRTHTKSVPAEMDVRIVIPPGINPATKLPSDPRINRG